MTLVCRRARRSMRPDRSTGCPDRRFRAGSFHGPGVKQSRTMRYLLVLPLLTILSGAHPAPELVVSVGHAGAPTRAEFAGHYLATADGSNVALIDLVSGRTAAHLPQRSLVEAMVASPAGDLLAVGTCGHAVNLWDMKVDAGRAYVAADAA